MKNNIFSRSTRECLFDELNNDLIKLFKDLFLRNDFPGIESKIISCFETESLRKKIFSVKTEYTGIILTPDILFWGMAGNKNPGVAAAVIKEISDVKDYEKSENYEIMNDNGLLIFGFIRHASLRSEWFIGLGEDKVGERCRHLLRALIDKKDEKKSV